METVALSPLVEFKAFTKIPRLNRDMVICEKIDGTNAAVGIMKITEGMKGHPDLESPAVKIVTFDRYDKMDGGVVEPFSFAVYAQSRRRVLSPFDDNYGFAKWVHENAHSLVHDLGPGLHYGEWWGLGINRGYGQSHKIFSLFNVYKWELVAEFFKTENLRVVPVLKRWTFDTNVIHEVARDLERMGSSAAPGWMNPEGIVVFHPASQGLFKVTLANDAEPKSLSQKRRLEAVEADAQ